MATIKFLLEQQSIDAPIGTELLKLHQNYPHLPFKFGCCKGICGKCAVKVTSGMDQLTKTSEQERETLLKKGLSTDCRLACQCALNGSIEIDPV